MRMNDGYQDLFFALFIIASFTIFLLLAPNDWLSKIGLERDSGKKSETVSSTSSTNSDEIFGTVNLGK